MRLNGAKWGYSVIQRVNRLNGVKRAEAGLNRVYQDFNLVKGLLNRVKLSLLQ